MTHRNRLGVALTLALAVWLAPRAASAQGSSGASPEILAILLAPPAVVSLLCDIVSVATLTNGFSYRGASITGTVFGGVTTLLSFLALGIGLSSAGMFTLWVPAGGVGTALGLTTLVLGIYGIAHPPPDPDARYRMQVSSRPSGDVQFLPSVWADRRGLTAGAALNVAL